MMANTCASRQGHFHPDQFFLVISFFFLVSSSLFFFFLLHKAPPCHTKAENNGCAISIGISKWGAVISPEIRDKIRENQSTMMESTCRITSAEISPSLTQIWWRLSLSLCCVFWVSRWKWAAAAAASSRRDNSSAKHQRSSLF